MAAHNPAIVQVLLEAGANPNLGRPIGEAAGHGDHRCLELLLAHGARVVAGTWTVGAAVSDSVAAVSLMLDLGFSPHARNGFGEQPLHLARLAVGARPEPSEHLYQVFTVKDAQITEIRVYPDRASALNRPRL